MSRYMWSKCECGKSLKHLILWNGGSTFLSIFSFLIDFWSVSPFFGQYFLIWYQSAPLSTLPLVCALVQPLAGRSLPVGFSDTTALAQFQWQNILLKDIFDHQIHHQCKPGVSEATLDYFRGQYNITY